MDNARHLLQDRVVWAKNEYDVAQGTEALVVLTDWNEFKQLDFKRILGVMAASPLVFDTRNIYDPTKLKTLGFRYAGIGRN